ncbi:P52K-like protein [Mya arenaria]|uniref:P52K-like protein n=1 Tax=Mya arenaria TaxID=6604 RepID=A0ABY7GEH1_MYAAR|nr:P52K-like protein [Mya arenaria]
MKKTKPMTLDKMFKRMFETATATACPEATGTAPSEHANSMDLDLSATESDSTKPGQAQPVKSTHSGPSYPDIATAASGELEAKWKWSILKDTWTDCHMFNFPSRSIHGKMRKLSSSWLTDHPWLRYSISTDALFCAPCFVFGRKDAKEKTFISTPVKDWSNLAKYVKRHELAESNHHNEDGDDKAGQHLASIMKFDFIIGLVVAEHVMQSTVPLSYLLQAVDCDLLEATRESQTLIRQFQNERADPNVWEALFQSAKDIAAEFEIEPSMPRLAQRQRNRANPPANDPQQYWQRALYFPFLDHLCQELSDRLIVAEERFRAQYLIPSKLNLCTDGMVDLIFAGYSMDLPQGNQSFHNEVRRWKARWQLMDENDKPSTLGETVASTNPDLYKGVYTVLTILLTMPASSATAERSFSVMRRVKTYLRSTMRTERMTGLALMHVYRDVNIDIDQVVSKFAGSKSRRLDFV